MDRFTLESAANPFQTLEWGMFVFAAILFVYAAWLIWAIYHRSDEIDRQIKYALDYTRRQQDTAKAIDGGEGK